MCAGSLRIIASSLNGIVVTPPFCMFQYWTGHLSFIGLIALMMMNLRVYTIVNAGLKKVKFPVSTVIMYTLGLSGVMVLYMALVSGLDHEILLMTSTTAITGQQTLYYSCQSGHIASDAVLYSFEGVILVLNGVLCWKTRMVPGIINKSKVSQHTHSMHPLLHAFNTSLTHSIVSTQAIARINLHVAILSIVCFGVEFGTDLRPWIDFMITGVCFFLCCLSLFVNYFAWTAYYLLNGYDLDKNLNVVKLLAAPAGTAGATSR